MEETEVDYTSKLPEPILQYILSFLLAKDAAQLSTLSKSWNSAWSSLSYLNFGDNFFYIEEKGHRKLSGKISKLVNVVDRTLTHRQRQKISIQKFWLTLPSWHWSSYVHNWIKTLVVLNVKELNLDVPTRDDGYNTLPEEIFAAKELYVLDLCGFKLELLQDGIKFSSLRVLKLSKSFFDEHFIRAICESCTALEDLTLSECHGLTRLKIAGTLPKLRKVELRLHLFEFEMVDIVVPNLEVLWIFDLYMEPKQQAVINVTACKALKNLSLVYVNVAEEWLENVFSSLPNLEVLHLSSCGKLRTMKISSDKLKDLRVILVPDLIAAELNTPNLTSFFFSAGLDQLPALKLKASILLKVKIFLFKGLPDSQWYSKFMKFLGNFRQSNAIEIKVWDLEKVMVIPKDMRKDMVPPDYGFDCLHITFKQCSKSSSIVDVLDNVLWIFPQLGTLSFVRDGNITSTLKFIYEDENIHCTSLPSKGPRRKLKEVKMENFTSIEQEELRNYLFKDAGTSDIPKECLP